MKRMVVGLDGSARERSVLDAALALADKFGGRLAILRAVAHPVELPPEAFSVAPAQLAELLRTRAQRALEAATVHVPRERIEWVEARIGTPWQVLCDGAREVSADLVVVGTHGYGGLDRLLGTTAARVVNHAPCSVIVVRDGGLS